MNTVHISASINTYSVLNKYLFDLTYDIVSELAHHALRQSMQYQLYKGISQNYIVFEIFFFPLRTMCMVLKSSALLQINIRI